MQRQDNPTIQWIDELPRWNRATPATLVVPAGSAAERQTTLKAFVARALSLSPVLVEIEHVRDRPPIIVRPMGSGIYASIAHRGRIAALALALTPVGVDVEIVDVEGEIPWRVLHPREAAMLEGLTDHPRAMAFARLWSIKEAYLKSLGVGLKREPSGFLVRFVDSETASVEDPVPTSETAEIRTAWRADAGVWTAVSTVVLARQRSVSMG